MSGLKISVIIPNLQNNLSVVLQERVAGRRTGAGRNGWTEGTAAVEADSGAGIRVLSSGGGVPYSESACAFA